MIMSSGPGWAVTFICQNGHLPSYALSMKCQDFPIFLSRGGFRCDDQNGAVQACAVNLELEYPRDAGAKTTYPNLGRVLRSIIALQSYLVVSCVPNVIGLSQDSMLTSFDVFSSASEIKHSMTSGRSVAKRKSSKKSITSIARQSFQSDIVVHSE